MAGDGSAVKSEPSKTPKGRAVELSKITSCASAMEQNSRWIRIRVKVEVKWRKTVDTVHSTLSFFKKSKKSKSKSVFSEELSWANSSLLYNQKIWKLSLLRRKSTSKAFTLDSIRATRQFKGGWCKVNRPSQTGLKNRSATRKVGPKTSARKREVLAWCESVMSTTSDRKIHIRAADLLVQQQIRDLCSDVSSVAALAATIISLNIIDSWKSPPKQGVIDCWIPKQASQNGPAAFNTSRPAAPKSAAPNYSVLCAVPPLSPPSESNRS